MILLYLIIVEESLKEVKMTKPAVLHPAGENERKRNWDSPCLSLPGEKAMIDAAFTTMIEGALAAMEENGLTRPVSLDLLWSKGPIAGEREEEERGILLEHEMPGRGAFYVRKAYENLAEIREHLKKGEQLRIWYSLNADDLCGLYWLSASVADVARDGQVMLVKLPDFEVDQAGHVYQCDGWKQMDPALWARYTPYAMPVTAEMVQVMGRLWENLKEEQGENREVIGGRVWTIYSDLQNAIDAEIHQDPADE